MGGAPTIEWIRDGVGFTPAAAASFRRLEARLGRQVDVNSTYRDYATQYAMWQAWTAYTEGRGPKPNHSRAINPDYSMHCRGEALDSDDWATPGFNALAAEYGWIRTAASDPTERHHFEYQSWNDQHLNDPVATATVPAEENPDMPVFIDGANIINWPNGYTNVYPANVFQVIRWVAKGQTTESWAVDIFVSESWKAARELDRILKQDDDPSKIASVSIDAIAQRVGASVNDLGKKIDDLANRLGS